MNCLSSSIKTLVGRRIKKVIEVLGACLGLFLICFPLSSQGNSGRILGIIVDQSGGTIAGATVTITDTQRGISRDLITDEAGDYNAPNLLPGTYRVRAQFKGFKNVERENILLEVGQDIRVDLSLQPGVDTQTITVTEQLPMIETTNATLGGTLSNETLNDLPLNGRNYQNLLTLHPGMMIYPGGGGWTQSTDGIRPEDNQYIIDGLTNDNPFNGLTIINGPGVAGDAATILSIDAIQEVQIEENPKAEYGGKPGAIVNVGVKSGTNNLHGTAFAFGRDSAWDARNFFNPSPQEQKPLALEQFGATVGAPIKKDKLFFFLGYEGERYTVGNSFGATVPEAVSQVPATGTADPANSFPDALHALVLGGATVGNGISQLSLTLTGCPTPLPTAASTAWTNNTYKCTGGLYPTNNGTSTAFPQGFPSVFGSDNGIAKLDYHINEHHTLSGMFFSSEGIITAEDVTYLQPQWRSIQHNKPIVVGANWTWVPNSRWANVARFGYIYMNRYSQQVDSNVPASQYGIYTGVTNPQVGSLPNIYVKGGFSFLGGSPGWPFFQGPDTVHQFLDYVSYLHGSHALKFGGEIRRNIVDETQYVGGKGAIHFNGGQDFANSTPLEDLLAGVPTTASILAGDPHRHLTQWVYSGSVQDDWRVTRKVVLNLGLRYDYAAPTKEANNLLGSFDPSQGLLQVGKQISSVYNGDHRDFGPRLGVAWDISGNGTTVIRAGYGIVFDSLVPLLTFSNVAGNAQNGSNGGITTVSTGAAFITCPAACQQGTAGPTTTQGTGTIAVSSVTVPGGSSSSLASNWQHNSATVPLFQANTVQCGDGLTPPATSLNPNPVPDPGPCNLAVMDRNFRNPYVTNWTFGIQHAFTNNLSLSVSYVGNHGSRLDGITDINQAPVGAGFPGAGTLTGTQLGEIAWCSANLFSTAANIPTYNGTPITCTGAADANPSLVQAALPFNGKFPFLSFIDFLSSLYRSNYNGLQATLTQRTAHGLSFTAGYTYSHALDDGSYNLGQFLPQDSTHPGLEYASSDFDIRHRFTFSLTYALPGMKSPGQLLQGWELNSLVTVQSGQPWIANDVTDNISGTSEFADRWDFFGNPADFTSGPTPLPFFTGTALSAFPQPCQNAASTIALQNSMFAIGCYSKGGSAMIPPALGTFGTMGRNTFRDSGFRDWDLSVTKRWKFGERLTSQFRAEFFNILNHPNFTNPYGGPSGFGLGVYADPSSIGNFGCGCATPDQAASNPVLGTGGNRAVQLGLKLIF
jgi:hypothetical protein